MLEARSHGEPLDIRQFLDVTNSVTFLYTSRIYDGEQRLDASYYSTGAQKAYATLESAGVELTPLVDLVEEIFLPKQFKRIYVRDKKEGVPLLKPSETLDYRPSTEAYLISYLAESRNLFIQEGWILVTCSGTVGRSVIVGDRLQRFTVSHDMIRIKPAGEISAGYLHTFMQSWLGQALISKDQYGSTVNHLEAHHIAGISVPIVPKHEQQHFQSQIDQVYGYRDDANQLLDCAEKQLYQTLMLVDFKADEIGYIPPSTERKESPYYQVARMTLKAFSTAADELCDRFDASFHIPMAKTAINLLKEYCPYSVGRLGNMVSDIFMPPRFKRTYVDSPKYGIPFMQGSHVSQDRYYGLQYLSHTNTPNIEKLILKRDQVLITRSGTIARIGMVTSKTNGWTASEHILRVTAKDEFNSGYIAAFLMSPYGQCQLHSKEHGAVVKELTEADTASIMIPCPPRAIQDDIGNKIIEAFEKLDRASALEEDTIHEFEQLLENKANPKSFLETARELNLDGPQDWSSRIEVDIYGKPFDIRS